MNLITIQFVLKMQLIARPNSKDAWEVLNHVFRQICSTLEGNCTFNDIKEIKAYMTDIIISKKEQTLENKPNIQVGTNISSHIPSNPNKKSRRLSKN